MSGIRGILAVAFLLSSIPVHAGQGDRDKPEESDAATEQVHFAKAVLRAQLERLN